MSMLDIQNLSTDEEKAYLKIVDGETVEIIGKKGRVTVEMIKNYRQFQVFDPQDRQTKVCKYPIDAFNAACRKVGGFEKWGNVS